MARKPPRKPPWKFSHPLFLDYFPETHSTAVVNVFANVLGSELETGNDKYISKIFKYVDTAETYKKHPNWTAYNQPTSHEGAAESDIVICDHGWTAAKELRFSPIKCGDLGN
jgi:hypothetical protein